jgi:hypothetical protein
MNSQIHLPPCLSNLLLQLAAERKRNAGPMVVPWEGEVAQEVGHRQEEWRRWWRRRKMNGAEAAQGGSAGKIGNDTLKQKTSPSNGSK